MKGYRASAALDAQLARYRAADEAWRACPVPGVDREQFIRRWLARLPVIEWPARGVSTTPQPRANVPGPGGEGGAGSGEEKA